MSPSPSSLLLATITQMVSAHADRRAVSDEHRVLTYRELDAASDVLASRLPASAADAHRIVVMLPRSIEAAIAFLAVLKTGRAYVPIDPATPVKRLHAMLNRIGADTLICASGSASVLEEERTRVNFDLADLLAGTVDASERTPRPERDRHQEAYVMFTSGSTGAPKGVAVPDRAIERLAIRPEFIDVTAEDVILHFAPTAFDASIFEIWAAWLNGAELAIFTEMQPTPSLLGRFIQQRQCSIAWLSVGLFNTLIDTDPQVLAPLRAILTGGDALSPHHIARAYQALPTTRIINGYGPTENTTFTCCYSIPRDPDLGAWSNIPIGQAIRGTTVQIVDANLTPVSDGTEGELITGGEGVALGYLNEPDLTAAKFVSAPTVGPGTYYRTGDTVVRRPDGLIEFRGRTDEQVKINGFRIEPQEIATHLKLHAAVLDAVVVPQVVPRGSKRLVGYVTLNPEIQPTPSEAVLRKWLSDFFQPAWVPTRILALPTFPLTPNGKINRTALPNPFGLAGADRHDVASNPAAEEFLKVVAETLAVDHVSPHQSFLTAGGDSLAAMIVIDHWAQKTGQLLTIDRLLSCSALSTVVADASTAASTRSTPAAAEEIPHGDVDTGPLSLSQEQVWFLARSRPTSLSYNVNCQLTFRGVDRTVLWKSLDFVFRRHGLLHAVLVDQTSGSVPQWQRRPDWPLPVVHIDLTHLTPAAARVKCETEMAQRMQEPFNLRDAPLIRWFAWALPNDEMRVLQCEHHLIHDGWSLERLIREWALTYHQVRLAPDRASQAVPPRSYFDLARWQRRSLNASREDPSLTFWRTRLAGMPHFRLPADPTATERHHRGSGKTRTDPSPASREGRVLRREVPAALVAQLSAAAQANGISLFECFLTAFVSWLGTHSNRDEIGLGVGIANRTQTTFAHTLGLFVNMVTLRTAAPPRPVSWSDFQHHVAQALRDMWPHQHVPFEQVIRQVNPERVADQNPLFEVLFSMHQRLPRTGWFDQTLVDYEEALDNRSAKFDLTAFLIQEPAALAGQPPRVWLRWEYRADRFDAKLMADRFNHYLQLLESTLNPDAKQPWIARHPPSDTAASPALTPPAALAPKSDPTLSADGLDQAVIAIWQPLFPHEEIGPDTNFFTIGGHSLLGMELIVFLEKFFDRELPLNSIFEAPTPRAYASLLRTDGEIPRLSLSRFNQTDGPPVVFIHGWAGDAFALLNLGRALEGHAGAYGLHADPQHGLNFSSLEELAEFYAHYINAKLQQSEYLIAGYSVGGILAWAVAQALQQRGRKITRLIAIDARPYQLPIWLNIWVHRHWSLQRARQRWGEIVAAGPQQLLPFSRRILKTLNHRLRRGFRGPNAPVYQSLIPAGAAVDHYQTLASEWKPQLFDGDVGVVWSTETAVDLPAAWKAWSRGTLTVRRVVGPHLKLVEAPMATQVAAAIVELIHPPQAR